MENRASTFKLGDRCVVKSSKRIFAEEYVETGIPFFRSKDVIDKALGVFERYDLFISEGRYFELKKKHGSPCKGDVLISSVGNRSGQSYVVKDEGNFYFKDGNILWLSEFKDLDPYCLSYWLKSNAGQHALASVMIGSAQKALTIDALRKLSVALPEYREQKAIARILGTLDDKIKLNRRMNATLEAMARALFQSWFVDFDPVRAKLDGRPPAGLDDTTAALFPAHFQDSPLGPIPQGWEVGSILQQANLLGGGTPKTSIDAYWDGDIKWASAKDVSQCGDAFLIGTERTITPLGLNESSTKIIPAFSTVVVARGATTGRLTMFGEAMAMNQTCYGLASKDSAPFALYCHARHFMDRMVHGAHGSVFDTITTRTFETTEVLLPPPNVLKAFDEQVLPIFLQIRANLHQSRTLAALRDTLLPKLLSGELRAADIHNLTHSSSGTDG